MEGTTVLVQDRVAGDELDVLMLEHQIFEYFLARAESGQCICEGAGKDPEGNKVTEYTVPILPEDIEQFPLLKGADTYIIRDIAGLRTEGSIHTFFKEGYEEVAP